VILDFRIACLDLDLLLACQLEHLPLLVVLLVARLLEAELLSQWQRPMGL
jgi:hypothetical protein